MISAAQLREMGFSYRAIAKKIGVSHSAVYRMRRKFAAVTNTEKGTMGKNLDGERCPKSEEQRLKEEIASLKAELRSVRKELDYQTIRGEALDEMINIAERNFNISIRKKAGAKH